MDVRRMEGGLGGEGVRRGGDLRVGVGRVRERGREEVKAGESRDIEGVGSLLFEGDT